MIFEKTYSNIEKFIEVLYQKKRLHSFLGYLSLEEFEAQILAGQRQKVEQQLTLTIK
ncbi:MAG: hypothetical protein QME57_02600 [Patescibacteria group bacterium]|nr:hypothetical protein [Patescibacteria group bacterium]